jgi:hypothetical protein
MSIDTSTVHRRLDSKVKIVGLELYDLLFVLLFAAVMNLIFGQTAIGTLMVFIIPLVMAAILFLVKRNKPDGFLVHFLKFHLESGFLSAGSVGNKNLNRGQKIYGS